MNSNIFPFMMHDNSFTVDPVQLIVDGNNLDLNHYAANNSDFTVTFRVKSAVNLFIEQ